MAEALSGLVDRVVLIATHGDGPPQPDVLRRTYGISHLPDLRLLGAKGRFGIHLFNLRAALVASRLSPALVLSRSVGAAAFAARLGLPTVWECHAPPRRAERLYWRLLSRARGFRRLVVISEALAGIMRESHPECRDLDILVAHDGVDISQFDGIPDAADARRQVGRPPDRPVAAYAGHLYAGRGIELILDCAEALPHWTFLISGGMGEDVARVLEVVRRRGLENVELTGFVENAALPGTLAVADVLLMPYQRRVMVSGGALDTARWMSPLKMFEYLAMGRAIIASDLPVLREVLDDSVAALVEPDRAGDWIASLRRLESPDCRALLAATARDRARRYAWSTRAGRIAEGLLDAV